MSRPTINLLMVENCRLSETAREDLSPTRSDATLHCIINAHLEEFP